MWKKLMELLDLDEPTSFLHHVYLGCIQRGCNPIEFIIPTFLWPKSWKNIKTRRILKPEMEILKQAPWSRIRRNSVNKEVWEIVGNGKQTRNVRKDTIAVSDTIKISVQK